MYPQMKYMNWIMQQAYKSLMKSWESCDKDCAENEGGDKRVLGNTSQCKTIEDKNI